MKTITIPKTEYLDLLELYKLISKKIENIKYYETDKTLDAKKYCGSISLKEDPLKIQNSLINKSKSCKFTIKTLLAPQQIFPTTDLLLPSAK